MNVNEVMSHPVVTAPIDSTLNEAARLMWECDCGIIPIVTRDGRLAGVITDRDICMAAYTQGLPLADIPVGSVMTTDICVCRADDTVEDLERLAANRQIRRVPVLDDDQRPIGIVSMSDVTRIGARSSKSRDEHEIVQTFAAICEPRSGVEMDNLPG